jgi:adenylate kinase
LINGKLYKYIEKQWIANIKPRLTQSEIEHFENFDANSDNNLIKLLADFVKDEDLESGIIFDGFPRTVSQAPKLDSLLGKKGVGLNYAIFLDVPEDVAKDRIKGRAEKEDRKDDADPKVIEKRFKEYNDKTLPLVEVYEKSKRLFKVDGTKGTDEVLKQVKNKLKLS